MIPVKQSSALPSADITNLVDSLPYFDPAHNESDRDEVRRLIDEEMRLYKPSGKNYLEHLGQPAYEAFETPLMRSEMERIDNHEPLDALDMRAYEIPNPTNMNDVSSWKKALDNSRAQLVHQRLRIMNLEALLRCGKTSWKRYADDMEQKASIVKERLREVKQQTRNVNIARKGEQTEAGVELRKLENQWVSLVSKNYEIECRISALEKELCK
ncbi:hypothetical protein ACOME3_004535 [Neoechinorhynchus agilis]